MNKVDWSNAPDGATCYAAGEFFKILGLFVFVFSDEGWRECSDSIHWIFTCKDYQPRPTQWPTESRIEQIGQNGGDGLHYDEQREVAEKKAALAEHLKQEKISSRAPDSFGKYDRRIKGKHNTGTCTVDVYRVLSAFEITEPELQHCIKKLLAAGQRGAKDYQQDLKEAAVSLGMLIDRLAE